MTVILTCFSLLFHAQNNNNNNNANAANAAAAAAAAADDDDDDDANLWMSLKLLQQWRVALYLLEWFWQVSR